ncbi:energy transducer TonB [Chryseobacterium sp. SIMBA_028]|uniref:energy transducer TonB n=1 Tax=Chryseobacterium sp. SIMBA_028 TaxID=3085771 RepID=UPI0039786BA1
MKKTGLFILLLGSHFAFAQTIPTGLANNKSVVSTENVNVETPAEFPGGMDALRKYIYQEINISNIKSSGVFTSVTKFVVNTNGNIESVSAKGDNKDMNQEMERVIKSIKIKWKPAQSQGLPVKYWVTLPTTINL